ncbi:MAG: hypothetical protein CMC13_16680 [Flavobacteriaceae bacterium]|nr:hypothetical protein [Flavobacteriaceae bacterium]|tara:strand:- start:3351 stop:4133 length:783 start_codon:yes stop_codon:yes gene_type:complete
MTTKKEKFARFGFATKGVVHLLIGIAAAMTAVGFRNDKLDMQGVIQFLADQIFGKLLLLTLVVGLCCYTFWLWYKTAYANFKSDNKFEILVTRISLFFGGIFYLIIAFSAALVLIDASRAGQGNSKLINSILGSKHAQMIAIIIGVGLLVKAGYQLYFAYQQIFKGDIESKDQHGNKRYWLHFSGRVGYTARGIVIGVMAYLFLRSGLTNDVFNVEESDAFTWLRDVFGAVPMGIIALGFAVYGFFFLSKSMYSDLDEVN